MTEAIPKLYTSADAALFLGVKVCTVRNECHRGKLGHIIVGGRFIRHTEDHLASYLKDREVVAHSAPLNDDNYKYAASLRSVPRPRAQINTDNQVKEAVSALARKTFATKPRQMPKRKDAA